MEPADWKGTEKDHVAQKRLGLRAEGPESESVSKASSVRSVGMDGPEDEESLAGVKISGPLGEDVLDVAPVKVADASPSARETTDASKSSGKKEGEEAADKTAKKGFIIE
jgi:hypothetical protein